MASACRSTARMSRCYGFTVFGSMPPVTRTAVAGKFPNCRRDVQGGRQRSGHSGGADRRRGRRRCRNATNVSEARQLRQAEGHRLSIGRDDDRLRREGHSFGLSTLSDTRGTIDGVPAARYVGPGRARCRDARQGTAIGADQHGSTQTLNVTLLPQGTLVVTVQDANSTPVPGARSS